jgi:cytoskeleton protein RodZ
MTDGAALGTHLRNAREAAALSLETVSARSRIAERLLRALEEGRADALPAPVYVRGFIRAYCAQVGVDPTEALARYDVLIGPTGASRLVEAAPLLESPPRRGAPGRAMVAASLVGALLIGAAGATWLRVPREASPARDPGPARLEGDRAAQAATSPVVEVPEPRGEPVLPEPTPPRPAAGDVPPPGAAATAGGPVAPGSVPSPATTPRPPERLLVMRADEAAWVRVRPGDQRVTEEILQPGTVREWRGPGPFTVTVGNAGGVRVELDGQPLPVLGARGQVVRDLVLGGGSPEPGR